MVRDILAYVIVSNMEDIVPKEFNKPELQLSQAFSEVAQLGTNQPALNVERTRLLRLRMILRRIRLDLAREEYHGVSLVLCPDFSEIYSYMYPFAKDYSDFTWSFLSTFVFEHTKRLCALPVATLYELNEHLNYLLESLRDKIPKQNLPQIDQYLNQPVMTDFMNKIRNYSDFKPIGNIIEKVSILGPPLKQLIEAWNEFPQISSAIIRLEKLLKQCKPISELISSRDLDIDEFAFETSIVNLTRKRPTVPFRNRLDSLNHALIYYINNSLLKGHNYYFTLITHGHPFNVFNDIPWHDDPLRSEEQLEPIPLVRDIVHCAYLTMLDLIYPNQLDKQINLIKGLNKQAIGQYNYVQKLRQTLADGQMTLPTLDEIEKILPATLFEMASLEDWNPPLFEAFNNVINVLTKRDNQYNREFTSLRLGDRLSNRTLTNQIQIEMNLILDRVEAVKKEIEEQISKLEHFSELTGKRSSVSQKAINKFSLKKTLVKQSIQRYAIGDKNTGDSLCSIDLYPKYFSVFTYAPSARLAWFLNLAHYMIAQTSLRDAKKELPNMVKYFDGMVIFTNKNKKWEIDSSDLISFPLDADDLWVKVFKETSDWPKFIRINSMFIDLWYEMDLTIGQRRNGKAGLISHIAFLDLVSHFITRSQERLVRQDILQDELTTILGKIYPKG